MLLSIGYLKHLQTHCMWIGSFEIISSTIIASSITTAVAEALSLQCYMAALIIQVQGVVKTFKGTQTWKQFPAMKCHAEISGFFKQIHMTNVGKIQTKKWSSKSQHLIITTYLDSRSPESSFFVGVASLDWCPIDGPHVPSTKLRWKNQKPSVSGYVNRSSSILKQIEM